MATTFETTEVYYLDGTEYIPIPNIQALSLENDSGLYEFRIKTIIESDSEYIDAWKEIYDFMYDSYNSNREFEVKLVNTNYRNIEPQKANIEIKNVLVNYITMNMIGGEQKFNPLYFAPWPFSAIPRERMYIQNLTVKIELFLFTKTDPVLTYQDLTRRDK